MRNGLLHDVADAVVEELEQSEEVLGELDAERGEAVADLRRGGGGHRARDEPVGLQRAQGLGQHLLAHPSDAPPQRAEPQLPGAQRHEYEHGPLARDVVEHRPAWAVAVEHVTPQGDDLRAHLHHRPLPKGTYLPIVSAEVSVERMITVTGVTGKLGGIVLDDLRSRVPADQIVAVARTPEKVDAGVEVRRGDYDDPASLRAAFAGADVRLLVPSPDGTPGVRPRQHGHASTAAAEAGV